MIWYEKTALVIAALGAVDLGLNVFDYELVNSLIGAGITANIIFAVVGLCGIWALVKVFK